MQNFFQVCAAETRASFVEKQRLGIIYHRMLSKQKLKPDEQRFFSEVSRRFGAHHNRTPEVLNCAAWGAGILPAGERKVFADTQEEVDDIWPEEQVRAPVDAIETYSDSQNSCDTLPGFADAEADSRSDDTNYLAEHNTEFFLRDLRCNHLLAAMFLYGMLRHL